MPDLTTLPLDQLLQRCPPLTQVHSCEEQQAWSELQRRAFVEGNDAAWDALVAHLWPSILTWIYLRLPDISPATAEQLAQQTIWALRRQHTIHPTNHFPALTTQIAEILHTFLPSHL